MSWDSVDLTSSNGTKIPIRAIQVFDHAMIHQGLGFTHNDRHDGIAAAATLDHLFVTGDHKIHMRVLEVESTGAPVSLAYYEDTVTSADGTLETSGNNNRTSSKTPETSVYTGPTITNIGNQIGETILPSTGGGNSGAVGILAGGEWVLKPNSKYLIRFTNEDTQPTDVVFTFFWYEPHNRT